MTDGKRFWDAVLEWVPVATIRVIVQDSIVGVVFLVIIWLAAPLLDHSITDPIERAQLHRLEQWARVGSYVVILGGAFARLVIRVIRSILLEIGVGNGGIHVLV